MEQDYPAFSFLKIFQPGPKKKAIWRNKADVKEEGGATLGLVTP